MNALAQSLLVVRTTKSKRVKTIRVRLGDNGCEVLWGRHFNSERWRLFRGNGVARTVEEQKGRAADGRLDEARGSLAGSISSPQADMDWPAVIVAELSTRGRKRGRFN